VELTWAWEVAAAVEVARVSVILAADTFGQEDAIAQDSTAIQIKDVEDRATLAKREARERVLRVEAENVVALASAHEDT
jgi:hypothetical protein